MNKSKQPINMTPEEVLLEDVNQRSAECRSIPHGLQREACFVTNVIPLMYQVQALGYSLEWDIDKLGYKLAEMQKGVLWVHPTIKRR